MPGVSNRDAKTPRDGAMTPRPDRHRRLVSEAVGTALLLATVVGSGIMGERLAGGNAAVALLANSLATGAANFACVMERVHPALGCGRAVMMLSGTVTVMVLVGDPAQPWLTRKAAMKKKILKKRN